MNQRVKLRALEPEDLEMLYQVENDTELWSVGASNVPYSRYALQQYIATQLNDIYADGQVRLVMENEEGRAVGMADLVNFDPSNMRAELGLVVVSDCRRRGYARSALRAVIDYARRQLHLHQIYAYIGSNNEACLQLFHHEGYQEVGELSDWLFDGQKYEAAKLFQIIL
jgi:diamine N-acetyltransferase